MFQIIPFHTIHVPLSWCARKVTQLWSTSNLFSLRRRLYFSERALPNRRTGTDTADTQTVVNDNKINRLRQRYLRATTRADFARPPPRGFNNRCAYRPSYFRQSWVADPTSIKSRAIHSTSSSASTFPYILQSLFERSNLSTHAVSLTWHPRCSRDSTQRKGNVNEIW
jgi:hypothetical protein